MLGTVTPAQHQPRDAGLGGQRPEFRRCEPQPGSSLDCPSSYGPGGQRRSWRHTGICTQPQQGRLCSASRLARPRCGEQKGRWQASWHPLAWRRLLETSRRAGRVLVSPSPPWEDFPLSSLVTSFLYSRNGCSVPVCLQGAVRATAGRPGLVLPWTWTRALSFLSLSFPNGPGFVLSAGLLTQASPQLPGGQTLQMRNPGSGRQCLARGHVACPCWGRI